MTSQLSISGQQDGSRSLAILNSSNSDKLKNVFEKRGQELSHGLMKRSIASGTLSKSEDALLMEVKKVLSSTGTEIIAARKKIDESIQNFYIMSNKFNTVCSEGAMKIALLLTQSDSDNSINIGELYKRCETLGSIAKLISARYFETSTQMMDLQKLNSEGKLGDFKGVINLLFFARIKELELLGKKMKVLYTQEDHEVKVMTLIQNERLKRESQLFDQYLKVVKFEKKEAQRQVDNRIKTRKAEHDREVDFSKLGIEKDKIRINESIDKQKLADKKFIDKLRINAEEKVKLANISTNERIEWGNRVVELSKCSVM